MAIFFHKDVRELLENKKIIVIGDSIQRSVYKDLICLWTQEDSRYLFQKELRAKGELAFLGDKLLRGGKLEGKMVNGTEYREVREFSDGKVSFKYYFVTRSYSEHMESILNELKTCQPDVIVMNSTFWDLHHYGDNNLEQYKANLEKLVKEISENFSSSFLFIWNAALPLADRCKGGFLRKGFLTIPIDKIKTANKLAWLAITGQENSQKKVYLDLFTELKDKENFTQAEDGIHWGMRAHRKISNLILTEVCTAWNRKIPDPPSQLPNQSNKRSSSPILWSQLYPDNDTWSPVSTSPYNDYDELEYWNYVPQYWGSPSYDRYQTPSPLLARGPSFYGSSWSNLGWSYNAPYGSHHMGRTSEYQPSPPAPYLFQRQYLSLGNMQFNFCSPYRPYYPEKFLFKPAYSEPLPLRSPGQGLLPTPPGPPAYAYFNEGDRYRDRFKKLSNPRACRFKPSATTTSTPISSKSHTTYSTPTETPKSSLSTDHNTNNTAASITGNSDHNNNKEQIDSVSESCLKSCGDSDAVGIETESVEKSSESTIDSVSAGGSVGGSGTQQNDVAQQDNATKPGMKRKHEDDEESNPSKIAREETTDVQRSGLKRKLEDIEAEEVTEPLVSEQANSTTSVVNGAIPCEQKRSRKADVTENPDPLLVGEDSTSTESSEKLSVEDCPDKSTSSGLNLVRHDEVRCALTYDSSI